MDTFNHCELTELEKQTKISYNMKGFNTSILK